MTPPSPLSLPFSRALRSLDDERAERLLRKAIGTTEEDGVASELFSEAAHGGPHDFWPITSHLFADLGKEWLEARAWTFAEPYLDGSDSRPFRELAFVFNGLGLEEPMRLLLERAARSDDHDIREVIEDFGSPD